MKFDFIIGNPPYQEENEKNTRKSPLYNSFMDAAYELSDVVELITPARFLFNAGQTPKAWNQKMLNDPHLKVLYYEPDCSKVFPNTDIKGGVAITYRNVNENYGIIGVYTSYDELSSILSKVIEVEKSRNFLDSIVAVRGQYRFTDIFYVDHPEAKEIITGGTGNMVVSNIFERLDSIFFDDQPDNLNFYKVLGRINNRRVYKFIESKYIIPNKFLESFNVILPESSGSGKFGESFANPIIIEPGCGSTDTFISIGQFSSYDEANRLCKYIKSKFARTLLYEKKVTQHNGRSVWCYVPLQDFTPSSDIDWTKSIPEIDQQLYAKYGLDETEIAFIESHVKEMK